MIKKHTKRYLLWFIASWLVACGLGIYLRLYTLVHHVSNTAEDRATLVVLNNIRRSSVTAVEQSNPGLNQIQKQQLAKKQFDDIVHSEGPKIRKTIDAVALKIQESSPELENPFYLMEADSYYYYNLTENILKTGSISSQFRGSKYFNPLMMAPEGFWEPLNLHPYIGAFIYKIVKFFNPQASLMEGLSYTPLIITSFIVLVFLFGCWILECHPGASFLGAVYLLCIPIFLRRSMFGWYKNDPINIFFLFLIPIVFFYGLKHLRNQKKVIYAAIACSFLLAVYSLFWQGWVFLASILIASIMVMYCYVRLIQKQKQDATHLTIFGLIILMGTFIGVSIVFGPRDFFILFQEAWKALQEFLNPRLSGWPDMYISVGELLSPTLTQWIEMMGGVFFLCIVCGGILLRIICLIRKPKDLNNLASIFLIIFALITIKLSFSAQRFQTLCLIPLALLFVVTLQEGFIFMRKQLLTRVPLITKSPFSQILLAGIAIFALAAFPFINAKNKTPEVLNKIFNSTWDRALTKIKTQTPQDSIVNTWWPPGHFVKAIAQRRVSFDGATINKPQAYWLANVLLANDEAQAAGILRMLNSSANQATDYLVSQGYSLFETTKIIKSIVSLSQDAAKNTLTKLLKPEQITPLLNLTHAHPPPSYLLIYQEMADDNILFSFVGHWDFKKVELINQDPVMRRQVPSRGSKEYMPYLWDVSGGPPRYSGLLLPVAKNADSILFENNIRIDTKRMECSINSPHKYGQGVPKSLIYEKDGQFIEKKLYHPNLPYSVMLIKDGQNFKCILADTELARSMLMRLYYYEGEGLSLFEPFIAERDPTNRTQILVYRINWQKLK